LLALLLALPGDARAEDPTREPLTPAEQQLGTAFLALTSRFGFPRLVESSRTASGLAFHYLPEGESPEDWHFRGSIVLVRLGATWEEGEALLPRYVEAFEKQLTAVNHSATVESEYGDVTYLDYELAGEGGRRHTLAALWQAMPGVVAAFQAQRRPERFGPEQLEQFKLMILELAEAPRGEDLAPAPEAPKAPEAATPEP